MPINGSFFPTFFLGEPNTIKAEIVVKIYKTVHTEPITKPFGVHEGRLIVLYHEFIEGVVKRLPKTAVIKAIRGIVSNLDFMLKNN